MKTWHALLEPASSWTRLLMGRYELTPRAAERCSVASPFLHVNMVPQHNGFIIMDEHASFMAEIVKLGDNSVPVAYHMVAAHLLDFAEVLQILLSSFQLPAIACSKYALEFALSQSFGREAATDDATITKQLASHWARRIPVRRPGIPTVAQLIAGMSESYVRNYKEGILALDRATHRHILCEVVNAAWMKHVHVADHARVTDIVTPGPHSYQSFYG